MLKGRYDRDLINLLSRCTSTHQHTITNWTWGWLRMLIWDVLHSPYRGFCGDCNLEQEIVFDQNINKLCFYLLNDANVLYKKKSLTQGWKKLRITPIWGQDLHDKLSSQQKYYVEFPARMLLFVCDSSCQSCLVIATVTLITGIRPVIRSNPKGSLL